MHSYSGAVIDLLNPTADSLHIEDIAHSLSMLCRFGGRVEKYYSVAEHSVRVSHIVPSEDALWGLLHDAVESVLCDLPRPIKCLPMMSGYRKMENKFLKIVSQKYGLTSTMPKSVKEADDILLVTEKRDLLLDTESWLDVFPNVIPLKNKIIPWTHHRAENEFLNRFYQLYNAKE